MAVRWLIVGVTAVLIQCAWSLASAQVGFIQVRATPGIQVFLDDVFVGVTVEDVGGLVLMDVPAGQRRLRFVRDGFVPQDATVSVAPGQVLLHEVGSLVPRLQVTQEGMGGTLELQLETGTLVVQCLPIECVVDIPALGVNNLQKTLDRLVARGVPAGPYDGTLSLGSLVLPVSFVVCLDDTVSLFGTFVGSDPGVSMSSEAMLGPECRRLPEPTVVRVKNTRLEAAEAGVRRVSFDIQWNESWRGPDRPTWVEASSNWDAAWVFVKFRVEGGQWRHATMASGGHLVPLGAVVDTPDDRMGVFLYRRDPGYGMFSASGVGLAWDFHVDGAPAEESVEVLVSAIEMVFVPQGGFLLGSRGSSIGEFRAGGTSNAPFVVSSQSSVLLGDGAVQLMWTSGGSSGSPSGNTHPSFPTGFEAFYLMKRELAQGEYVNFLNTLTPAQAEARKHTDVGFRYAITGSSVGEYATSLPLVAMGHMSWEDAAAFADWAGLRPLTELEFEKAGRGNLAPVPDEFAWGSVSIARASGLTDVGTEAESPSPPNANSVFGRGVEGPSRAGAFAAMGRSRAQAGASYYGVLDLSGNLWERVVTVGSEEGRAFLGAHGDGELSATGHANTDSWPSGVASGTGFRGGSTSSTVSDLRLSHRGYAADADSHRSGDRGWRGARSAP